jgi:hypothetical protein
MNGKKRCDTCQLCGLWPTKGERQEQASHSAAQSAKTGLFLFLSGFFFLHWALCWVRVMINDGGGGGGGGGG